jgi:uncharacterized membrane protein YfcA
MIAIALAVGLLIGLSLGALGGGGSILTVPALVYLLHQSPRAATTGSLLVVGITALAGTFAHWRQGRVRVGPGVVFGLLGVAGSYVGTRLSAAVDPHILLTAFAGLILVVAAAMSRRQSGLDDPADSGVRVSAGTERPSIATALGSIPVSAPPAPALPSPRRTGIARVLVAASAVGLLTGFFGVGGGFVIVPALVLALGFPMAAAVGTSLLVISINSATALAARLGGHLHLDWPLLAGFTGAAIAGSLAGNRVASGLRPALLVRGFVVLLVLVGLYTAARSVPHLA